jgi:hypothetical protein
MSPGLRSPAWGFKTVSISSLYRPAETSAMEASICSISRTLVISSADFARFEKLNEFIIMSIFPCPDNLSSGDLPGAAAHSPEPGKSMASQFPRSKRVSRLWPMALGD